jgi:hypothetical protein
MHQFGNDNVDVTKTQMLRFLDGLYSQVEKWDDDDEGNYTAPDMIHADSLCSLDLLNATVEELKMLCWDDEEVQIAF